jgi:transposase
MDNLNYTAEQKKIGELERENAELKERIKFLEAQIESLSDQLKKDSHNSSKPPSSDGFKKNERKSTREPSGNKQGGQAGHDGQTLEQTESPDQVDVHKLAQCLKCGFSFDPNAKITATEYRQVFDITHPQIYVTEHRAETIECPNCFAMNKANFPPNVSHPVQYGERIIALCSYLSNYQLIPLARVVDFLSEVFGCHLSVATLIAMNEKIYNGLQSFDDAVKEKLTHSPVLHVDESGLRCQGQRQWLHCASTEFMTYYAFHKKRGKEAMDGIGILPGFRGTLIHDFWTPYLKYSCSHGLCNEHHLRELIFLIEEKKCAWASHMKRLLLEIKDAVDIAKTQFNAKSLDIEIVSKFEEDYKQIINQGIQAELSLPTGIETIIEPFPPGADHSIIPPKKRGRQKKSKSLNLLNRLKNHQAQALAFMYNFEVPFSNNQAERDIRMIKLRQKISGTFRADQGAMNFCRIRSYISTVRKNGRNVLAAIENVVRGHPFIPIG